MDYWLFHFLPEVWKTCFTLARRGIASDLSNVTVHRIGGGSGPDKCVSSPSTERKHPTDGDIHLFKAATAANANVTARENPTRGIFSARSTKNVTFPLFLRCVPSVGVHQSAWITAHPSSLLQTRPESSQLRVRPSVLRNKTPRKSALRRRRRRRREKSILLSKPT